MIESLVNWSASDFLTFGTIFGFILGCMSSLFILIGCKVEDFIRRRKDK